MKSLSILKKIFLLAFSLICFPVVQVVLGQDQINMTDFLRQKFQNYCELVPREEVYVVTDREVYISGEILWLSTWLIDRESSLPSSNSKILYLEILSPENVPVAQKRIYLDKGNGYGQIELPDSLETGTYSIRAYTSWMKNFLPYNCFLKDIKIYNAFNSRTYKHKIHNEYNLDPELKKADSIFIINSPLTLKVNNLNSDKLELFVNVNEEYAYNNNNLFYLFIQTHGTINFVSAGKLTDNHSNVSIPKTLLSPGINQITLFDFEGQPLCERYIYTPDKNEEEIFIHSIDSFATRSKATLEINIKGSGFDSVHSTNLCVSVVPAQANPGYMKMREYMVFGSEFGLLPENLIKDRKIKDLPNSLLDSLLLNIKSKWISWERILSDSLQENKFHAENEDHYISGILLSDDNQHASSGEVLLISSPGKVPSFQYTTTGNDGKFCFGIHTNDKIYDLVIQPDDISKKYNILLESSFSERYLHSEVSVDSITKPLPSYISTMGINYQIKSIYGISSDEITLNTSRFSHKNLHRFYGKPDAEIIMKDWVKLPSMEEVFFEIVPHTKLRKEKTFYEMVLTDQLGNILFEDPPGMMVDGVIIKDPNILAKINPDFVEKIDVINKQYMVGNYLFNGIVNIITKAGNFGFIPMPDNSIRIQYNIFDLVSDFISPVYSSPEMNLSHEPDFRNTLYWNPSIKPDSDGKVKIEFWTSDVITTYRISVQGMAPNGKTLTNNKTIKIK